jgi:hypothetical protein
LNRVEELVVGERVHLVAVMEFVRRAPTRNEQASRAEASTLLERDRDLEGHQRAQAVAEQRERQWLRALQLGDRCQHRVDDLGDRVGRGLRIGWIAARRAHGDDVDVGGQRARPHAIRRGPTAGERKAIQTARLRIGGPEPDEPARHPTR